MPDPVLLAFTVESEELIRTHGWSGYWHVNPARSREFQYVLFCQNFSKSEAMKKEWEEFATATKPHGTGFMLARIADVVPANQLDPSPDVEDRWIFTLSEFAKIDLEEVWKGWRFPINYQHSLQDFGLDPATLQFEPMPPPVAVETPAPAQQIALTEQIEDAGAISSSNNALRDIKKYASERLGVRSDEIEITITLAPSGRSA